MLLYIYTLDYTQTDVQTSEWRTMPPHCAWKQKYKEVIQITSFFDEHAQLSTWISYCTAIYHDIGTLQLGRLSGNTLPVKSLFTIKPNNFQIIVQALYDYKWWYTYVLDHETLLLLFK